MSRSPIAQVPVGAHYRPARRSLLFAFRPPPGVDAALQAGVSLGLVGIAFGNPQHSLVWTVACAFFVAFSSATQDVVVDGWRIGAAPVERQGMMSATYQLGYRIALLCAGAAHSISPIRRWKAAYCVMALLMVVGISASVLRRIRRKPSRADRANLSSKCMPSRSPICCAATEG